jgi:chromosome segregation ATPase
MSDFSAMNEQQGGENSIAVVAARIQERANEAASERAAIELAKAELAELEQVLKEESKQTTRVRRTMLETVRLRHGVEMELLQIRNQQEERLSKLEENQRETEQVKEEITKVHDEWEGAVKDLYVEHELQRELYRRSVSGRIKRREELVKEREERLRQVERETRAFEEETQRMVEETKRLEKSALEADSREQKEDEEMDALAMQIQATIQKVGYCMTCVNIAF